MQTLRDELTAFAHPAAIGERCVAKYQSTNGTKTFFFLMWIFLAHSVILVVFLTIISDFSGVRVSKKGYTMEFLIHSRNLCLLLTFRTFGVSFN